MHAVGKRLVGDEIVAAPSWVGDDSVSGGQASEGEADEKVELHVGKVVNIRVKQTQKNVKPGQPRLRKLAVRELVR